MSFKRHKGAKNLYIWFITLSLCGLITCDHEPPAGVPVFIRSSVESVPKSDAFGQIKQQYSLRPSFGDVFLPLRSAVESIPSIENEPLKSSKSFVRSAIEYRPVEDVAFYPSSRRRRDVILRDNKNDYSAYYVSNKQTDDSNPPPYRFGSPYQQIVDVQRVPLQPVVISNQYALEIDYPGYYRQVKPNLRLQCFFTNWAFYRSNDGKFVPENIDPNLCTEIILSFASLDPNTLTITEFDKWVDVNNDVFRRATQWNFIAPVTLAIGGWTDSAGDKYSRLVKDRSARKKFISSAIDILKLYDFRGLHFDWNYPKCWQSECDKGPASDKANFATFIGEMCTALHAEGYTCGISISGYKEVIVEAYDLRSLSRSVDYMTVMTYDYHGAWEKQTGHVSPLYGKSDDKYPQYNTDYTMQFLVSKGAEKSKLIVGVPFYGQTFTMDRSHPGGNVGYGTKVVGPGEPGEYTKQPGMMAYYEICNKVRKEKWTMRRDDPEKSGPHAWYQNQWVSYEDPKSVELKSQYVISAGYGGIAAWTIDLDDFSNRCCSESFPLLKAINRVFGRLPTRAPSGINCQKPPEPVTPVAPEMTPFVEDGQHPGHHEHTTWPSWSTSTMKPTTVSTTWWTTTKPPKTTSTTKKTTPWWAVAVTKPTTQTTQAPYYTTQPPYYTTQPTTNVPGPTLAGIECEEHIQIAHHSCNKFYRCNHGKLEEVSCGTGLHFNSKTQTCDWPDAAGCVTGESFSTIPPTTTEYPSSWIPWTSTTPRPSYTTVLATTTRRPFTTTSGYFSSTSKIPVLAKPKDCTIGNFYPGSDCEHFKVCVNGHYIENYCGTGLQWNQKASRCDYESNVRCVTDQKLIRLINPKATNDESCRSGGQLFGDPTDCSVFYICDQGNLFTNNCPSGLHFNSLSSVCDWPQNAHCEDGNGGSVGGGTIPVQSGGNEVWEWKPPTTTTTTARPRPPRPDVGQLSGYYKLVCYFTNWAWYRQGDGKYLPEDINEDLCTHIVYGFAVLDYSELIIRTHDSWADIDNKFYERVANFKRKGAKVTLAIGGWNDSQGDKYMRLLTNPSARRRFITHVMEFIEKHGFEGLDLDYEYPACPQTECNRGNPAEKEGFTALVRELSQAFKPRGWLLSAAVSPSKKIIDAGYEVAELSQYFDWIAVMTYDYHGQWDKKTGHVAPLFYHPEDDYTYFNTNYTINYWIELGAPSRKIVLGMPLYGQSFTLENQKNNGLNAKAPGPGTAGEFTRAGGFLAYYEICDRVKNRGWTVVKDPEGRMGPYAYHGNQWVSYDDEESLSWKTQMIRSLNLGGGMVWALDLDDFKNRCGDGVHPLLTTIQSGLRDPPTGIEFGPTVGTPVEATRPPVAPTTPSEQLVQPPSSCYGGGCVSEPELPPPDNSIDEGSTAIDSDDAFKIVCYFTNWAWYRQGGGRYVPEDIDANLCTHIVYGFAVLDRDRLTIKPHDSWADLDNNFYTRVIEYKKKGIKVTVALGGWNDSAGDKYSRLVRDPSARRRFIQHISEFIAKHGFDGLDLDWEYPKCWQTDCTKGYPDEKQGFAALVRELSAEFKPRGWLLSSAVSPNKKVIDEGYDVPTLSKYFDWIAVMTYDYHGQWDKQTGHVAPMYEHPEDFDPTFNSNYTINYWISEGADKKKLVMGMPMYGQSFSLADNSNHGLNVPTYGGGEAGEATRARGFLSYYEICQNILTKNWKVYRDEQGRMGPHAVKGDQWVSFDDIHMIKHKSEYVKAMEIGGAMIWALDLDDFKNICGCEEYPLLRTINRVLARPSVKKILGRQPRCHLENRAELEPPHYDNPLTSTQQPHLPFDPIYEPHQPDPIPEHPIPIEDNFSINERPNPCVGDEEFYADPNDCSKYYQCSNKQAFHNSCPPGLHWDTKGKYCDYQHNVKCKTSSPQAPVPLPLPVEIPLTTTRRPVYAPSIPTTTVRPVYQTTTTRRPVYQPTYPPVEVTPSGQYKVVCYFTNWAWYRPGDGKYTPDDIDANLCTHIVYGFAVLDRETMTIKTHDSWADIDNRFYERVVEYKKKGIRVTLALGGWNDSLGDKYSKLVLSPSNRARFIREAIRFIEKYEFEGLDLDWEYPVCWQTDCSKGRPEEKAGFSALVVELSNEFRPRGWLLSSAVSPSKMIIDAGYDVPLLATYFDWIAVMTYDYHGQWDKQTGHVAPLYYYPGDTYDYFNSNFTIHYWMEKGAPAHKLVMGMPMYGQSFALADTRQTGLNSKSYGPGEAGTYTRAGGFLSYYEICSNVNKGGWTVERDPQGRIGPYAYKGNQWVSYDDVEDIRRKSQFVKDLRLGGGMIWALDLDDFRGICGCGKHPLLSTINQELRGIPGQRRSDCT